VTPLYANDHESLVVDEMGFKRKRKRKRPTTHKHRSKEKVVPPAWVSGDRQNNDWNWRNRC
jgi:hypothetical protein